MRFIKISLVIIIILLVAILTMAIKHEDVKAHGDKGYASEWNKDHVVDEGTVSKSASLIVAANDSLDKTKADYVCDGAADQVEINAAITAIGAQGGRVILLEGTFILTDHISLADNVTLQGQGKGTEIKPASSNRAIEGVNVDDAKVCDLYINGYEISDEYGVHLTGCSKIIIENMRFFEMDYQGVYLHTTTFSEIKNCILDTSTSSIKVTNTSHRNIISNNILEACDDEIIIDAGCVRNSVHGNLRSAAPCVTDNGTNTLVADNQEG